MSECGPTREELTEDPRVWMNAEIDRLRDERDTLRQELVRAERRQTVYLDLNAGMREALQRAASAAGHPDAAEGCRNVIAIVRAVLAGDAAKEETPKRCGVEWIPGSFGASVRCELLQGHEGQHSRGRFVYTFPPAVLAGEGGPAAEEDG